MSVELVTTTFEQVIEGEEPAPPCECSMHKRLPGDSAAEWLVTCKPPPCGCVPPQGLHQFWCDECLRACLAWNGTFFCRSCDTLYTDPPLRLILVSYEPIRSAA